MIPEFALQLICGLSTVWCIAPRSQITSGFFRIQMLIALGLSVLLFLTSNQFPTPHANEQVLSQLVVGASILLGLLAFSGSVAWTLERRKGGTIFAYLLATSSMITLVTVAMLLSANSTETPRTVSTATLAAIADTVSAAWLIGSVTSAMLLGHWYLTATGMPLKPFTQYNVIFLVAATLRMGATLFSYSSQGVGVDSSWGLLTLRWAGLIGPFIIAILTIRILRYRNTQSATGVLYAATTLVFMGEMAANLIEQSHAIPTQL
ncbi:hypothetical protein [Thalassoglobus sp.]|uniref:hypothetical protein n=1 Tax=Thalassoglobus sp. TaxID=2795869 RepID=UPI003AA9D81B